MLNTRNRHAETPICPYSIQGRAWPSLLLVRSISPPKKISDTPSNSFDTIINVPMTALFNPTAFVR